MRSVNLIPPDEQRGESAPMRTGVFSYVLIAGLALLLLGIVAVALTSKQISDRKAEKASLETELAAETARAQSLAAFTNFKTIQENRTATLTSLAQTRFDWSRVLRELSLILPPDIMLTGITGTVSPEVEVQDADSVELRSSVAGPALEVIGCAPNQDSTAGFVSSLEDIDGVTRVGLDESSTSDTQTAEAAAGASTDTQSCPPTKPYKVQLVVAFDAVPTPATASAAPSAPAPAAPAPAGPSGQQEQVSDPSQAQSTGAVNAAKSTASSATSNLLPGG
jgi:Tfp pilus assembly protein PilN